MRNAVLLVLAGSAALACSPAQQSPARPVAMSSYRAQVSGAPFNCTLPVTSPGRLALLDLPGGTVHVARSADRPGVPTAYASRFSKWIPGVLPQWISPDGSRYAIAGASSSELDVVDIASGRSTRVWSGLGGLTTVLGFGPDGIYFSRRGAGADSGVWMVSADRSRAARRVGPTRDLDLAQMLPGFSVMGGGAAWAVAPPLLSSTPSAIPTVILRMDLRTGRVQTYFQGQPGEELVLLGVDTLGEPVVMVDAAPSPNGGSRTSPPRVQVIGSDGTRILISREQSSFVPSSMVADEHGTWFGGPGSVWLYRPTDGVREVASIPTAALPLPTRTPGTGPRLPSPIPPDRGPALSIAGPCR